MSSLLHILLEDSSTLLHQAENTLRCMNEENEEEFDFSDSDCSDYDDMDEIDV